MHLVFRFLVVFTFVVLGNCTMATNVFGENNVLLSPPVLSITAQPTPTQSLCVGGVISPLTFTVAGTSAAITYQWYSNSTNVNSGGLPIPNATTISYTPSSTVSGTVYYYCVATAPGCPDIATDVAEVVVLEDPTLNLIPSDPQTVCVGGNATLTVQNTSGVGPITYQWFSNTTNSNVVGTPIANSVPNNNSTAQSSTFTPLSLVLNTVGTRYYFCKATFAGSGCGVATSPVGQVVVVADPVITVQPTAVQTVCFGGIPEDITVGSSGGFGTPVYQWFINTTNNNTTGTPIAGATNATYTFAEMNTPGTFYYYCRINMSGAGCNTITSAVAQVNVVFGPTVSIQPLAVQIVCLNGTPNPLTISVLNGQPALYVWYCTNANNNTSGQAIPGANAATFTPPTNVIGTRYYYCRMNIASELCNGTVYTMTSAQVGLTVVAPPSMNAQPIATQTICLDGTPNALTVSYTGGTGTPTYQWYSNTTNSNTGGTAISGATANSYTAPGTTVGTFYYYCVITLSGAGCNSITSNVGNINVIDDPIISTSPLLTQTICVGGVPTGLSTTYSGGTGNATYQWYLNTTSSTTGGTAIANTNLDLFTPNPINTSGDYYYYATISLSGSGCGTITSNAANVIVVDDPSFTNPPTTFQSICVGGTTTALSVVSTGGTGEISYQWYSNSTNSSTGGNPIAGATATTYTPPNTPAGSVYYYCQVSTNGLGCTAANSNTGEVLIAPQPTVSAHPTVTQTICDGGTPNALSVSYIGGAGTASYQWYSNSSNSNSGGTPVSGIQGATYTPPALSTSTYYYCVITLSGSACGSTTSNAAAVVVVPDPIVASSPLPTQTICVGGVPTGLSTTYSGGTGNATYQWYLNTTNSAIGGTAVANATSASFIPNPINSSGDYYYYATISLSGSGCGTITSNAANVIVVDDPSFTTSPSPFQSICVGGTTTALSVVSTGGTGLISYQWYSNSTNSSTGGNPISGATSPTFTPPNTPAGSVYYYCQVSTNGLGCTAGNSNTGEVLIAPQPTVSAHPTVTQTICEGGTPNSLSVSYIGGAGTASYQWYSNSSNSNSGGTPVSGIQGATYTPPALSTSTYYYCVITLSGSACGSAISNTAEVVVVADPTIFIQPLPQSVCQNGLATSLSVQTTGGTGSLSYEWYVNSVNSVVGGVLSGTSPTLTPSTNVAGVTYIYVEVSASGSGCNSVTSETAAITIVPIPAIDSQPLPVQTVCQNSLATALTLSFSNGSGSASYQWYSNSNNSNVGGQPVTGATDVNFIPNTANIGSTYYYCTVSFGVGGVGCGTVTTDASSVIVIALPTIDNQPTTTQTVCVGGLPSLLSFSYSNGTQPITFQWYSNSANSNTTGTIISGANLATYNPPVQNIPGSYYYYCVVTFGGSGCGSISTNPAEVIFISDPTIGTPSILSQTICSGGTPAQLNAAVSGGSGSVSYQWYSNINNSTSGGTAIGGATNATYTPLSGSLGTTYYYVVATLSGAGCGSATSATSELNVISTAVISTPPGPAQSLCLGGTIAPLSVGYSGGVGAPSYQWYSNVNNLTTGGTPLIGETNATFIPANTVGTLFYYAVITLSGSGCGSISSQTATVTVAPQATIITNPTLSQTICTGGMPSAISINYSGGAGTPSYYWFSNNSNSTVGGNLIPEATSATFTPLPLNTVGSTFYYGIVSLSGSGCSNATSNAGEVIVVNDPTISMHPITSQELCINTPSTSISATVSSGNATPTYAWYSSNTPLGTGTLVPGANTSSLLPTNNIAGTNYYYMVATVNGSGCDPAISNVSEVIVHALPNVTITLAQDSICFGTTTNLVANNAQSYVWTPNPSITSPANLASVTVAPVGSVTYTVQGTDANGCVNTTNITVFAASQLTVQESLVSNICFGSCVGEITLTPAGSVPSYTVTWTNPALQGLHPTNLCAGNYSYVVTDDIGCTRANTLNVVALPNNPLDNVTIVQPTCSNSSNGSIQFTDATTISYQLINATTNATIATQSSGTFSSLPVGNYNVIYQDAQGCSYTATNFILQSLFAPVTLAINPLSSSLCFGQNIALSANVGGGNGSPISVTWGTCSTLTNCILGSGNPLNYTITGNVTLYAQATSSDGCTSNIQSVNVNLPGALQVEIQNGINSIPICIGQCVDMTAAATGGGTNPIVIQWYEVPNLPGGPTIGPNGNSNTICPVGSTSVYVFATDGCAAPAVDTLDIILAPSPDVTFTTSTQEGCAPVSVTFVNNTTPALSASCAWDMGDGTIISGCANQDYTYSDVGTFIPSLTVVSPIGCEATYALPAPIEVHGYPTAMFSWSPQPIDPMQPTAYFNNNSTDAVSSFWEFAWLGTSTETNPEFTFPDENLSSYPVCLSVVNEFGCIDTLCKTVIFNNVLQVWVPNAFTPEQDGLNEVFLPIIKGTNPNGYHFSIFDRWGTLIFESFEIGEPWIGDVRDGKGFAQDGTYFWRLEVSLEGNLTIDVYTGFVTVVR